MNEIHCYETKYDKNGIKIIKHRETDINELIRNLNIWHDEITRIMLCPKHLFYYATNNSGSEKYVEELPKEFEENIKDILELLVNQPEEFYEIYKKNCEMFEEIEMAKDLDELFDLMDTYGIKNTSKKTDIEKIKESVHKKLSMDYAFGIFGEILFYNVVENLLYKKLMLSKVQFVTAPGTNAHGSDGVFCDDTNKILYFGEAKFTVDLESGIKQAIKSMDNCLKRVNQDVNFMKWHTRDLKNDYEHVVTNQTIKLYGKSVIIFLLHGEEINDDKILEIIEKYRQRLKDKINNIDFLVVSFPIYSKENLKGRISKGVQDFGK